jgi:hypothetical protein
MRETIQSELLDSRSGHKRRAINDDPSYGGGGGSGNYVKRKRCGECEGCLAENCGTCDNCKDMPCFGGKGTKRQSCRMRMCVLIAEEDAKMKEERDKEREERHAVREAEREAKRAEIEAKRTEREANRANRPAPSRTGARAAGRQAHQLQALLGKVAGARLPTVRLDSTDVSAGWGARPLADGDEVEIRLDEDGLTGAIYTGRIIRHGKPPAVPTYYDDSDEFDDDEDDDPSYREQQTTKKPARKKKSIGQALVEFDELLVDEEPGGGAGASEAGGSASKGGGSDEGKALEGGEGEPARLQEWVELSGVRTRPPTGFPPGVIDLVRAGDLLELFYEDGWWPVEVLRLLNPMADAEGGGVRRPEKRARRGGEDDPEPLDDGLGARFLVSAIGYDKQHKVKPNRLRPRWLWADKMRAWRYELLSGHGCVPKDSTQAGGRPAFKFAASVMRRRRSPE